MPLPTQDDYDAVNDKYDDAIRELLVAVTRETVPRGPYSRPVYDAAEKVVEAFKAKKEANKVVEAFQAMQAVYNCETDPDEYKAELARRRQIGLTIDPATAETTVRLVDVGDPYDILDRSNHVGRWACEYFARHSGGDWILFQDLPDATDDALWKRDYADTDAEVDLDDEQSRCPSQM